MINLHSQDTGAGTYNYVDHASSQTLTSTIKDYYTDSEQIIMSYEGCSFLAIAIIVRIIIICSVV